MIRAVIADDQELVRSGFRLLLESEDDIEVVGEAADGQQAAGLAERLEPDVVLMDIRMPKVDGLEGTRLIAARCPERVRVLMVTTYETDAYVFEALRAGASGFVLKDIAPAALLQAIRTIVDGGALLAPTVTRRLIGEFVRRPAAPSVDARRLAPLTDREREVMVLVARGMTNDEIAEDLVISPATARTHVSRAMLKLRARDRAQLVVIAYQTGLVTVEG